MLLTSWHLCNVVCVTGFEVGMVAAGNPVADRPWCPIGMFQALNQLAF